VNKKFNLIILILSKNKNKHAMYFKYAVYTYKKILVGLGFSFSYPKKENWDKVSQLIDFYFCHPISLLLRPIKIIKILFSTT
jgi:hypothetical protein